MESPIPFFILALICAALVIVGGFLAVGIWRNRERDDDKA